MKRQVWLGRVLPVLAGALIGLAVICHLMGWNAVDAVGGGCGGRSGPCPAGTTPTLITAFAFTFLGAVAMIFTLALEGPRRGRIVAAVLAALLALPTGWAVLRAVIEPVAPPAWSAAVDRPSTARALAAWQAGETVVRARADRLDGYRAADGGVAWSLAARPRESVCAAGRTVVDGVVAVAYGRGDTACNRLTAVDLRTGRELWRTEVARVGSADLAGALVVVSDAAGRLSAYALRDGAPAWSAPATAGCEFRAVAGSPVRATAVEYCEAPDGPRRTWLRAFAPDGTAGWRTDLGAQSRPAEVDVLAADPPTVRLTETDKRGLDGVLALGGDGALRATVPLSTADLDLTGLTGSVPFELTPAPTAAVVGDLLVVSGRGPGATDDRMVAGYSLADGARRWIRALDGPVLAARAAGDGVTALVRRGRQQYGVVRLDAASGTVLDRRVVGRTRLGSDAWIGVTADRYVVLHEDGTGADRPAVGIRRR